MERRIEKWSASVTFREEQSKQLDNLVDSDNLLDEQSGGHSLLDNDPPKW
jgi:hypothetical protein